MVKSKCTFCPAEIDNPRGDKAIGLGWHVMEFCIETKNGKIKETLISCPEDFGRLMPEFDMLMALHMNKRVK